MKFLNFLVIFAITIGLSNIFAFNAEKAGLPHFFIGVIAFTIGLFMPLVLNRWLYGEDNKASKTEESEESSKD